MSLMHSHSNKTCCTYWLVANRSPVVKRQLTGATGSKKSRISKVFISSANRSTSTNHCSDPFAPPRNIWSLTSLWSVGSATLQGRFSVLRACLASLTPGGHWPVIWLPSSTRRRNCSRWRTNSHARNTTKQANRAHATLQWATSMRRPVALLGIIDACCRTCRAVCLGPSACCCSPAWPISAAFIGLLRSKRKKRLSEWSTLCTINTVQKCPVVIARNPRSATQWNAASQCNRCIAFYMRPRNSVNPG